MEQWELNEEKKEYLRGYQEARKREKRIEDEIQRLRADKMFPSLLIDDMPHGTDKKDLSDYAAKLDEQIRELSKELDDKAKIYNDITKRINKLGNSVEQDVLTHKYIAGMSWQEIAEEMGYSRQHIHRLHGRALNNFEI